MTSFLTRFRFPIAVALTSLALVVALGAVVALLAPRAFAGGPWSRGHGFGPGIGRGLGHGFELPAELHGLRDLAPGERFAHFQGAQLNLTDRDNRPVTVSVTPGTATSVSPTSVTLAANDGSTKTFALSDRTLVRGRGDRSGEPAPSTLAEGSQVVVVTLNHEARAHAVVAVDPHSMGWRGHRGAFGGGRYD
jgi:hypothetical protein